MPLCLEMNVYRAVASKLIDIVRVRVLKTRLLGQVRKVVPLMPNHPHPRLLSTRGAFLDKSFNYGPAGQVGKCGRGVTQPSETSFRRLGMVALSDL